MNFSSPNFLLHESDSVYSVERKAGGKSTTVKRKADASRSTALRRFNVGCCPHFGRKVRHCSERLDARNFRSFGSLLFHCGVIRPVWPPLLYRDKISRCSTAFCSAAGRSNAVQRCLPLFGRFLLNWGEICTLFDRCCSLLQEKLMLCGQCSSGVQ